MLLQPLYIISYLLVNSNWSYSPETPNLGQIRQFLAPCDLEIWQMTLKNNRAPLSSNIKLCVSFHHHMWIQTGVTALKRLSWVVTSVTLSFDLWPWPFAWTLPWSLLIIPENFMMIRWWEHSQTGVTDGQMDRKYHSSSCLVAAKNPKNVKDKANSMHMFSTSNVMVKSYTVFYSKCFWYEPMVKDHYTFDWKKIKYGSNSHCKKENILCWEHEEIYPISIFCILLYRTWNLQCLEWCNISLCSWKIFISTIQVHILQAVLGLDAIPRFVCYKRSEIYIIYAEFNHGCYVDKIPID